MVSSWLPIYVGLPKYNKSTWNVTATRGQSNLTESASRGGGHSPVRGHPTLSYIACQRLAA